MPQASLTCVGTGGSVRRPTPRGDGSAAVCRSTPRPPTLGSPRDLSLCHGDSGEATQT